MDFFFLFKKISVSLRLIYNWLCSLLGELRTVKKKEIDEKQPNYRCNVFFINVFDGVNSPNN